MNQSVMERPYDTFLGIIRRRRVGVESEGTRRILFADNPGAREQFRAPTNFRELDFIQLLRGTDKKNFDRARRVLEALRKRGFEPHESGIELLFEGELREGKWVLGVGKLRDERDSRYDPSFLRLRYDVPCGEYTLTHQRADKPTNDYLETGVSMARIFVGFSFPDDNAYFV